MHLSRQRRRTTTRYAVLCGLPPLLVACLIAGCRPSDDRLGGAVASPPVGTNPGPPTERTREVTLTILYDNHEYTPGLRTAWGFACLVEGLEKTILFDTGGDGEILLGNMDKLGISATAIDAVVLSHVHGDHTGGLPAFLGRNSEVTVFMPESFPASLKRETERAGAKRIDVTGSTEICRHAFSTGEMGTSIKEQALAVETLDGLVVITGCAHPGVVDMVKQAKQVGRRDVHLVLGGFHMSGMSEAEVRTVIDELTRLGVERVGPCHCSGDRARRLFRSAYGDRYVNVGVGRRLQLGAAE
jgi:7,8-dihydropterin-6-yl-methyl-4-(beta-D-ribofuranosyl)aminobenzene 5'-phosphate synthase